MYYTAENKINPGITLATSNPFILNSGQLSTSIESLEQAGSKLLYFIQTPLNSKVVSPILVQHHILDAWFVWIGWQLELLTSSRGVTSFRNHCIDTHIGVITLLFEELKGRLSRFCYVDMVNLYYVGIYLISNIYPSLPSEFNPEESKVYYSPASLITASSGKFSLLIPHFLCIN